MKVIDVSYHNGTIDWVTARNHIDGAILRCGYGDNITSQDDKQWKRNAYECTRLGIPFGVYIYSYATSLAQAKSEADHVLRLIRGYKLSYPVYYDLEEPGTEAAAVQNALTFCETIEKAGYMVGIYANNHWFNKIIGNRLDRYTKWIARYSTQKPDQACDMWQYTSDGSVPGIAGRVDMNNCYRNFPAETAGGSTGKTVDEIANEVIAGKWGNGADRKNRITAAGYNYSEVQARVNEIKGGKKSVDQIVEEVMAGKWGNGSDRRNRLQAAGYDYDAIQSKINQKYKAAYYPAFGGASIVDGLRSIGVDNSMTSRQRIAAANGIGGYTGTAAQNNKLMSLAKAGKLRKA